MPSPASYVDSIQTTVSTVVGEPAPKTGEYYTHLYSGKDIDTGIPIVGLELHEQKDSQPVYLNDIRDAQALDIILNSSSDEIGPAPSTNSITIHQQQTSVNNTDIISDGGALQLGGIIVLALLFGVMWLVYTIIRIWQNNQAHRAIVRATTSNTTPIVETPVLTIVPEVSTAQPSTFNFGNIEMAIKSNSITDSRNAIGLLDAELNRLLTSKGISGQTLSDKLKTVSAGQFHSIDMAWEAHQSAKELLAMHDDLLKDQDLTRVLKLFKQVFAEHGVI